MNATKALRPVVSVVASERTIEGGGFTVRRPFPTRRLMDIDPFLVLDEMGPVDYNPGEAIGAPDHPHRGFETVTYVLDGEVQHKDSHGHAGVIGPGDVQWMTAGAGVVHSEMPTPAFQRRGGAMHGFQLWVNLPAKDKMIKPRYQGFTRDQIPRAVSADGKVTARIVAGDALGKSAVIETRTPIHYVHYTIEPGGRIEQSLPADYNAFAFVFGGAGKFGADGRDAKDGDLVRFGAGDAVVIEVPADATESLELLLIGGRPLNEPVARYGPFVMNTEAELRQAFADYQSGRLGSIDF